MQFSSSGIKNKPRKKPAWSRQQRELCCLAYTSTLKMEEKYSYESSINFHRKVEQIIHV
jgi:hypothetical protein